MKGPRRVPPPELRKRLADNGWRLVPIEETERQDRSIRRHEHLGRLISDGTIPILIGFIAGIAGLITLIAITGGCG